MNQKAYRQLKFITVLVCLIALAVLFAGGDGEPGPDQEEAFEKAKAIALEQNKPLLVDFYTTWCPPCKIFKKESKSDTELKEALQDVVLLKIDCERGKGVKIAETYSVERYPTFILMNPQGTVLQHWTGYRKSDFLQQLKEGLEVNKGN